MPEARGSIFFHIKPIESGPDWNERATREQAVNLAPESLEHGFGTTEIAAALSP